MGHQSLGNLWGLWADVDDVMNASVSGSRRDLEVTRRVVRIVRNLDLSVKGSHKRLRGGGQRQRGHVRCLGLDIEGDDEFRHRDSCRNSGDFWCLGLGVGRTPTAVSTVNGDWETPCIV